MKKNLTPLENFRLLTSGKSGAWAPFTLDIGAVEGFTSVIQKKFEAETGASDPAEFFDYDFRIVSIPRRFGGTDPRAWHEKTPPGTEFDEWGVGHWAGGAEDTYEQMFAPFARMENVEAVEAYPEPVLVPDPGKTSARARAFHERGYPVIGYAGSIYEWSWWLRGMEQFMVDLLAAPELARAIIAKVAAFTRKLAMATADAGIDVLAFYDDAGSQHGMQISPDTWRAFIKPAWKGVLDAVRERHPEAVFFLHSCGDVTAIVPDIVELGFDVLHPVQPECMDGPAIKQAWGATIIPCATLGAQRELSRGSEAEVRRETTRLMDRMAFDCRAIVCPSNRVQPETPWENVTAFVEAARGHKFSRGAPAGGATAK